MTDQNLCFGQGILLKGTVTQGNQGALVTKGFADTEVYYETFRHTLCFKNYRNAIFEILPHGNFEMSTEAQTLILDLPPSDSNLLILQERAQSEHQKFQAQIKNLAGSPICFGDKFILRHVDSGSYVTSTLKSSSGTKGAFSVEVTDIITEGLIFIALPYRSFEVMGSPIKLNSPIFIKSAFNNGFLTYDGIFKECSPTKLRDKPNHRPRQRAHMPTTIFKMPSAGSRKFNCVTHFKDLSKQSFLPMPWRMSLHTNQLDNDELIAHDIVYLSHTDKQGVLTTNGFEVLLKEPKVQPGEGDLPFYDCLWEVEKHHASEDAYILRHLVSGMLLGAQPIKESDSLAPRLQDISELQASELSVIQFRLAKMKSEPINSSSFVHIMLNGFTLNAGNPIDVLQFVRQDPKALIAQQELECLLQKNQKYVSRSLQFNSLVPLHCFVIEQISDNLKSQVLFALSFHSKILELRETLRQGGEQASDKLGVFELIKLTEKIESVRSFIRNSAVANQSQNPPVRKRQVICKDLGLADLLFELLKDMRDFMNAHGFEKKPKQRRKLQELSREVYLTLADLIQDNSELKMHVAKNIEFVLVGLVENNDPAQMKLLKEFLSENDLFVFNLVSKRLVEHLCSNLQKFGESKYLDIFRLFCVVGSDRVNPINQIQVLNTFFNDLRCSEGGAAYHIFLSSLEGEVYVEAAIDRSKIRKKKFEDFHKLCIEDYQSTWEYFVSYLTLSAEITKGQNKTVEGFIESLFPIDVLTILFQKYKLYEAEVPVIKLLHYLYLENDKLNPIDTHMNLRDFYNDSVSLISTKSPADGSRQPFSPILSELKIKLALYSRIKIADYQANTKLLTILQMLNRTICLGFWKTKDQVAEVMDQILRCMTLQEIEDPRIKGKGFGASKESQLVFDCLSECLSIVQTIIDFDIDLAVQRIITAFKKFDLSQDSTQGKALEKVQKLKSKSSQDIAFRFLQSFSDNSESLVDISFLQQVVKIVGLGNPQLTRNCVSIVSSFVQLTRKALSVFCCQVFYCTEQSSKLATYVSDRLCKFSVLEDKSMPKVTMQSQNANYFLVYNDDTDMSSGIMQDLYLINELLKKENSILALSQISSLDASRTYRDLAGQKLIDFVCERTSTEHLRQKVLFASNLHSRVLKFILCCQEVPTQPLARKLLHLCYMYLTRLVWNFHDGKIQMMHFVEAALQHMTMNLGAIDFLREIFDNNKKMLDNEVELPRLVRRIAGLIIEQPAESYYRSKLLDFFRFLVYFNGSVIKTNQILILKILQEDSYAKAVEVVSVAELIKLVDEYSRVSRDSEQEPLGQILKVSPRLLYLITYLQIMSSMADGDNKVNISKLVKRYSFQYLTECSSHSKRCWPLKRNLRALLNRLYYFQPGLQNHSKRIAGFQIINIIKDFDIFIETQLKPRGIPIQSQYFQNPVRFSFLASYYSLHLEEVLFSLNEITVHPKLQISLKKYLHAFGDSSLTSSFNFIKVCERLGWLRTFFTSNRNIFIVSFIKLIQSRLKIIMAQFDNSVYLPQNYGPLPILASFNQLGRAPTQTEKEKARDSIIANIVEGAISSFYINPNYSILDGDLPLVYLLPEKIAIKPDTITTSRQHLRELLTNVMKRKKRQFASVDHECHYKMTRITESIKLSSATDEFTRNQLRKKFAYFDGVGAKISFVKEIISVYEKSPDALEGQQLHFLVSFITHIIEETNLTEASQSSSIEDWKSDSLEEHSQAISQIQNKLMSCRLGVLLKEQLKSATIKNTQLLSAVLSCGIGYLIGGNSQTQRDFIEKVHADELNTLMQNIERLISNLGRMILRIVARSAGANLAQIKNEFQVTTIDNYDYYNDAIKGMARINVHEGLSVEELKMEKETLRAYQQVFKFLQLLCENNNLEGKKFILQQPKLRGTQCNLIQIANRELRGLFNEPTQELAKLSPPILDFLLEVTQIPASKNQQALMNSSFLEDLCRFYNTLVKQNDPSLSIISEAVNEVFAKGILIILSNLEGNQEQAFRLLDTKLEPMFLVGLLSHKLKQMNIENAQDLTSYIKKQCGVGLDDNICFLLNILTIFMKLRDRLGPADSRLFKAFQDAKSDRTQLFERLEGMLLFIEIKDNSEELQTVYFPRLPMFDSLSAGLRDQIMKAVQRSTHRDKIVSLIGYVDAVKSKMQSSFELQNQANISENLMNTNYNIAAIISLLICTLILATEDIIFTPKSGETQFLPRQSFWLLKVCLCCLQLVFTFRYTYCWAKLRVWQKPQRVSRTTQKSVTDSAETHERDQRQSLSSLAMSLLYSGAFYRLVLFISASVFGAISFEHLYFIHIIDLICKIPMLSEIFQAVAYSAESLVYLGLIGIALELVFCSLSLHNYLKSFAAEVDPSQTLFQRILQLFMSGVVGGGTDSFESLRTVLDLAYMTLFGLLYGKIIEGVMLNAFSSLRQDTEKLEEDKKNLCYICNISREALQKEGLSFQQHIQKKHFLWNYVFYICVLESKSPTDFSGLEYQIALQYQQPDEDAKVDWVPLCNEQDDANAQIEALTIRVQETISILSANTASSLSSSRASTNASKSMNDSV